VTEFSEIPVLDVSAIHSRDSHAKNRLTQAFADAYGSTGFGYIVGHGIAPKLQAAVFAASCEFHALPVAQKMALRLNRWHRGYIPINTSTDVNSKLADVTRPNQSASFMIMREDAVADPSAFLSGPNQWPALPGFRVAIEAYVTALTDLCQKLMRVAIQAAGGHPNDIMPAFEPPTTWLRLLHYPPMPAQSDDDLYGSAPHTDFGCLTILAQDEIGGLQVQTPRGSWVDAPYMADAFVVNVGDMLHRLSNGRLRSTPHRVINRSGRERYSCPFFFDPNVNTIIAPLPGTGEPQFGSVNFGEFLRAELQAGYQAHQISGDNSQ